MAESGLELAMENGCILDSGKYFLHFAIIYMNIYHEYRKAIDYFLKCLKVYQDDNDE